MTKGRGRKRGIILLCLLAVLCIGSAVQADNSADKKFTFNFPNTIQNSMRNTKYYLKTESTTDPYVETNATTIETIYCISTSEILEENGPLTVTTNYVTLSKLGRRDFTWNSGYGGSGQDYCLCGCPSFDNIAWNAYRATGIWDV